MLGFLLQEGWCHTDQALCYKRVSVTLIRLCVTGGLVSHWSGFVTGMPHFQEKEKSEAGKVEIMNRVQKLKKAILQVLAEKYSTDSV